MEEYFTEEEKDYVATKLLILVIYDICNDRKRQKLAKLLEGYGFRVQKSAFETYLDTHKYHKLLEALRPFCSEQDDSIRIYKLYSKEQVTNIGKSEELFIEDLIII